MSQTSWIWVAALLTLGAGCVTQKTAALREEEAFAQGAREGMVSAKEPSEDWIIVQGDVRNIAIPWKEDLTLAEAILQAEYTGRRDPRFLRIISADGEIINIDPKTLLYGEDYFLKKGDLIEIRR